MSAVRAGLRCERSRYRHRSRQPHTRSFVLKDAVQFSELAARKKTSHCACVQVLQHNERILFNRYLNQSVRVLPDGGIRVTSSQPEQLWIPLSFPLRFCNPLSEGSQLRVELFSFERNSLPPNVTFVTDY